MPCRNCRVGRIALLLAVAFVPFAAVAEQQSRIKGPIDDRLRARIYGNSPLEINEGKDLGTASDLEVGRVTLIFKPSPEQASRLELLLRQQQDPASPKFHQWLSSSQFADEFGLSKQDVRAVSAWLESRGVRVDKASPSRTSISVSGPASRIAAAFATSIHRFELNGELHYANSGDPSVPESLADLVLAIRNLDNFPLKPSRVRLETVNPNFTSSVTGNHFLAPNDLATIYDIKPLYERGITGKGQRIAVVGQTNLVMSDLQQFRRAAGMPANDPQVLLVPGSGNPGVIDEDLIEANLDLQWAGAIAPEAEIIYVNSGNGVLDSLHYAVEHNVAPVISISYGNCEQNFSGGVIAALAAITRQANAQGQTIVAASGDRGATDCDYESTAARKGLSVNLPASLPYVTGVGGTRIEEQSGTYWHGSNDPGGGSARGYIPEVVWNDSVESIANGGELASGGGGVSARFTKPDWQIGIGVPDNPMRNVPDISLAASARHDGYLICNRGSCVNGFRSANGDLTVIGGTSAGAPVFAGFVALLNQLTGERQGNANPMLYWLANQAPDSFHDVVHGDNKSPCTLGSRDCPSGTGSIGFSAATGYDLASGLGSIDAHKLASAWQNAAVVSDFELSTVEQPMSVSRGSTTNATVAVSAIGSFSRSVLLSCELSESLAGTQCSIAPGSVVPNSTVVLTISSPARGMNAYNNSWSVPWILNATFILAGMLLSGQGRRQLFPLLIIAACFVFSTFGCGEGSSLQSRSANQASTTASGTVTVRGVCGDLVRTVVIPVSLR